MTCPERDMSQFTVTPGEQSNVISCYLMYNSLSVRSQYWPVYQIDLQYLLLYLYSALTTKTLNHTAIGYIAILSASVQTSLSRSGVGYIHIHTVS